MKIIILSLIVSTLLCCNKKTDNWENGQSKEMIIESKDTKTSYKLRFDSLGKLESLTPFFNNKVNGTHIYFNSNSEIGALMNFKKGQKEGYVFEFRPHLYPRFKGVNKENKFNGEYTIYYENGIPLITGNMRKGLKEGLWKEFYKNGAIKSKGYYKNDNKLDKWEYWNIDGSLKSKY